MNHFVKYIYLPLLLVIFLFHTKGLSQCDQNYDWAVWSAFTGNSALGTITQASQTISVEMTANYSFNSTPGIFNYGAFNGFSSVVPNSTVPRTTWAAGVGGVTTMCFSEVVSNPVLLLASLGSGGIHVTLELSLPYQVIYDGGGMSYLSDTSIYGAEGYAILLFPGDFECVTIYSSTPEFYTNITWGLNPPLFDVELTGELIGCDSTTIMASGGSAYAWSGGVFPDSSSNTFLETGSYFLTVTDDIGCEVVTSVDIQLDTACADCLGIINGTAVLDECGDCLEPDDPLFNASCTDCLGVLNGTAIYDECGECLQPDDPLFNQSCTDCLGVINGTAIYDECGECLEPDDPLFNESCTDCLGVINGTAIYDECGECLEPDDPLFNQSCTDCLGVINGTAIYDECGECLQLIDPDFNQSCADCNGVPNGTAVLDECGVCLETSDPNFNLTCIHEFDLFVPNVFSPNGDGINDVFKVYNNIDLASQINVFSIFDRWGDLVYQVKNQPYHDEAFWWDGNFGEKKVEVGVYVYFIELEFENGTTKIFTGSVTLVK